MIRIVFLSVVLILLSGSAACAATWGESLFKEKSHDFGRVALGSDTIYRFEMMNMFKEDIRILGVHSSCGCTIPSITKKLLKSQETGAVVARFNTSGQYTREKIATLSVDLETTVQGQTIRETVLLSVSGYIRPDVVLTPGIAEFGSVREGHAVSRVIDLEYTGRSDWALTKVERSNPYIHAKAEQIKRVGGEVAYRITVTLKDDAPVGYVKDVLRFSTNEASSGGRANEIVLPIQGLVMAPIQAKPSPLMVGILAPGESVAKSIVIRSGNDVPFRITDITTSDKRFCFTYSNEESAIQLISVLFTAKESAQEVSDKIRIQTNLPDQDFVTVEAKAIVLTSSK